MDTRFIILGSCICGQCLTVEQMIDPSTAKCLNCSAEFHLHIDLEPLLTIEEWEQKEVLTADEYLLLPF